MHKKILVLISAVVVLVSAGAAIFMRHSTRVAAAGCSDIDTGYGFVESQSLVNNHCQPTDLFFVRLSQATNGPGTLTVSFWLAGQNVNKQIDHTTLTVTSTTSKKYTLMTNGHLIPTGLCATAEVVWKPHSGSVFAQHGPTFCNYCPTPLTIKQSPVIQTSPTNPATIVSVDAKLQEWELNVHGVCHPTGLYFAQSEPVKGYFTGTLFAAYWVGAKQIDHNTQGFHGVFASSEFSARTSPHILSSGQCVNAEVVWVDGVGGGTIAVHTPTFCTP